MIGELKFVHGGAWRYMLACPLLFAVPVLVEFVQHAIEMRIGMYESIAAAQAVEAHGARLGWGLVKAMSITVALYWAARFLLLPGGAARAGRLDPLAVRLFGVVMLWSFGWTVAMLWGGGWMAAAGMGEQALAAGLATGVILFVLDALLAPWKVASALGNADPGFIGSIRLVGWKMFWAMAFILVAVLPPMVLHYALSLLAIGAAPAVAWPLLALDSLVVGYLAALMAATNVAIAGRAADAAGPRLAPA